VSQLTFWSEELPANHLALQDCVKDLTIQEATSLLPMWEFLTNLDPSGAFGKMCQVSSVLGGGRDFGSFLGALGEVGYGWAYRVLDAQYFGVPQRRRRVFVVGCLGDWRAAAEVLFDPHSLSGNTEKGQRKKQNSARNAAQSIVYENHPSDSRVKVMGNVCQTVTSSWGTGGGNIPFVQAVGIDSYNLCETGDVCQTIKSPQGGVLESVGGVRIGMDVRRLTPIECERLQGFPDNYTNIKEDCPDGSRYKALGNSMAVPVMRWIGEQINQHEQRGMEKHLRG
jgi:DNA (cytosine-5)-methyltransferase 1